MGDAALDPVRLGPFSVGQRRDPAGVVHNGGETFLCVVNDEVIINEALLFLGQGHAAKTADEAAACKPGGARLDRGMVNPFALSWLWRGFKGRSVTFAFLFASFMLGMSLSHWVNVALTRLGVHWLYAMIIPAFFFMWLAKREDRFIPDEAKRKLYARSLIAGSIALALSIAWLRG